MRKLRRPALVALVAILVAATFACRADDGPKTTTVVDNIPWSGAEAYSYQIVNSDEEPQGEGLLAIIPTSDGLIFTQRFSDEDGNSDGSALLVNKDTLLPSRGERNIIDAKDDRREQLITEYGTLDNGDHGVRIEQRTYDPRDETDPDATRCNPLKARDDAYDNDSSLFIWRTINFEEGKTVTYENVLPNVRDKDPITLRVRKQERVKTPAGEFDAWAVGIERGTDVQLAWFATTPDHKLLVYNNKQDQVFLYTGEAEVPAAPDIGELSEDCRGK
jgi:hypothetical protein